MEQSGVKLTAKFGDIVENGWASERNPTRVGFFVREGHRPLGRMNPGRYWQITDGKGKFWELSPVGDHRISVRPAGLAALSPENDDGR
jgi:hypothetical protein